MTENVFKNKEVPPDEPTVKEALGEKYTVLEIIREYIKASIGETREEWKFYGQKIGWTLKTFYKKRNLFFIGVYKGYFNIAFVFGDRAVNAIMDSDISPELKSELESARKYAEGRGLRIKVEDDTCLENIKLLLQYKIDYFYRC